MAWKPLFTIAMGLAAFSASGAVAAAAARAPAVAASAGARLRASLAGTDWRFVEVGGTPVPRDVTAVLRLRNGRASGRAGCNSFGASWELADDGSTRFGALMSTKMACFAPAGAMRVQRRVFDALRKAARVRRDGDGLVLLDASGLPLARLRPEPSR
ncbi:MAG: META domain-containing protein [Rhodanobacteraceae bacterium]